MKKLIQKVIKETIEETERLWALNYIAIKKFEDTKEPTPEDLKNHDAAQRNKQVAEEKIVWLKKLLKNESI